ncbi:MAG: hypothetical protein J7559_04270 [Cohnella sp.]|nr:hypothetical protein [Cohnella sp.]
MNDCLRKDNGIPHSLGKFHIYVYAGFVLVHSIGRNFGPEWRNLISKELHQVRGGTHAVSDANEYTQAQENEEKLQDAELNEMIEKLCESKADEFRMIGYDQVTGADVWECVSDKYHKKGTPSLHEVVNDILSLKVTQFMNFITLNMYRGEFRGR